MALESQATFVPNLGDRIGGYSVYRQLSLREPKDVPPGELDKSLTKEIFTGHFAIDGETAISAQDGKYYFWQIATVHSPRFSSKNFSKLTLFT
eukprot:CAMPEP_0170473294 /NCGR_PEP_ID=MMETSP0123-20130129/15214_1 /TAXON_ID=182087 /ORGANISM="Favella ehrenbergii, Strain Fehren 1" /LENGTH=92 /DNA_ID=CAMNT_0010742199 /DNA_START=14 /DNA_END=292 /DNA_ORIENTATION=-